MQEVYWDQPHGGRDEGRSRVWQRETVGCNGLRSDHSLRGCSELGQAGWASIPCFGHWKQVPMEGQSLGQGAPLSSVRESTHCGLAASTPPAEGGTPQPETDLCGVPCFPLHVAHNQGGWCEGSLEQGQEAWWGQFPANTWGPSFPAFTPRHSPSLASQFLSIYPWPTPPTAPPHLMTPTASCPGSISTRSNLSSSQEPDLTICLSLQPLTAQSFFMVCAAPGDLALPPAPCPRHLPAVHAAQWSCCPPNSFLSVLVQSFPSFLPLSLPTSPLLPSPSLPSCKHHPCDQYILPDFLPWLGLGWRVPRTQR